LFAGELRTSLDSITRLAADRSVKAKAAATSKSKKPSSASSLTGMGTTPLSDSPLSDASTVPAGLTMDIVSSVVQATSPLGVPERPSPTLPLSSSETDKWALLRALVQSFFQEFHVLDQESVVRLVRLKQLSAGQSTIYPVSISFILISPFLLLRCKHAPVEGGRRQGGRHPDGHAGHGRRAHPASLRAP
jgi:hypothetical protein